MGAVSRLALAFCGLAAGAAGLQLAGRGSLAQEQAALTGEESFLAQQLVLISQQLLDLSGGNVTSNVTGHNGTGLAVNKTAAANKTAAVHNRTEVLMKQQESLQNLLSHLKTSISRMNKREQDGKETSKKQVEKLQERLANERTLMAQKNISAFKHELLVNRTRTDEAELRFWTRSRDLQHGMFHSSLKMTHGLMKKADAVMKAFEAVLKTGKLSGALAKQLKDVATVLAKQKPSFF